MQEEKFNTIMDNIQVVMIDKIDAMLKNLHQTNKRVAFYRGESHEIVSNDTEALPQIEKVSFIWLDVKKSKLPLLTVTRTSNGTKRPDIYFNRNTKMVGPNKINCSTFLSLPEIVVIETAIFSTLERDNTAIRQLTETILKLENKGAL